ncbi:MAG: MarR family transcriptional regulator [Nitriliruptoraceae bacterium]
MRDHVDELLDQWRHERPDVDPWPMGVVGRLSRTARWLEAELRHNFARFDLLPGEFDILATLRRSGSPFRLTAGSLVESSMVTSGAITNRVDRLVAKELVTRETDASNRRRVLITLTDQGRELIDEVLTHHLDVEAGLLSALEPQEQTQLAGLLQRLLVDLGDVPGGFAARED